MSFFLLSSRIPLYVYTILFIHLSVDGHLGCFYFWYLCMIMRWTSMYKFLCGHMLLFLLGVFLGVEILGHMLTLTFWGIARVFSKAAVPLYIPTCSIWGFHFFPHFHHNVITCPFGSGCPRGCEVVSHCDFDLHFPHV